MRKAIFISALLVTVGLSMNSCKKCYNCTKTTTEVLFGQDTTEVINTEVCSGKNGAGSRTNLNSAIQDIESNGYICTAK